MPFKGKNSLQVLNALANVTPPPPIEVAPETPRPLSDLITELLAKDREQRPISAELVNDRLSHVEAVPWTNRQPVFQRGNLVAGSMSAIKSGRMQKQTLSGLGRGPLGSRRVLAGGFGFFAVLLSVIWVVVRDRDGNPVAKFAVPPGGSVTVRPDETPSTTRNAPDNGSQLSGGQLANAAHGATRPEASPPNVSNQSDDQTSDNRQKFRRWLDETAKRPAGKQVQAVTQKLIELNPDFDGRLTPVIVDDVVTELEISNITYVTDLAPLRALQSLGRLVIQSGGRESHFADLSPLKFLPLSALEIRQSTDIADLRPLRGTRIRALNIYCARISDLSPLQGGALEVLQIAYNEISDLTPLKGNPLRFLNLDGNPIHDFSQLREFRLERLSAAATTLSEADLKYLNLRGLQYLNANFTPNTALTSIQESPLTELHLQCSLITDFATLQSCPLKILGMEMWGPLPHVSDFSPLRDLPLEELWLRYRPGLDAQLLRSIPTLKAINEKPAAEFCAAVEAIDERLKKPLAFRDPEFKKWVDEVAALQANDQEKQVTAKMRELNPGFNEDLTCNIENGEVNGVSFNASYVTDLSPLRAFTRLKHLHCQNRENREWLKPNLTPSISDLSPLEGLPLVELDCAYTYVSDLSPLRQQGLQILNVGYTRVSDLSPLSQMPIHSLNVQWCPVTNLDALRGLPLETLIVAGTRVADLSPIDGRRLEELWCEHTLIKDLSLLKTFPLRRLRLIFNPDQHAELLKSITTLEEINLRKVRKFWEPNGYISAPEATPHRAYHGK